jgi:hypothetical protein
VPYLGRAGSCSPGTPLGIHYRHWSSQCLTWARLGVVVLVLHWGSTTGTGVVSVLPGQGWELQSWYSTGDPLQALGLLLPSAEAQVRLRVRKPLAHSWEQVDHVSHGDHLVPPGCRSTGRPLLPPPLALTKSSTRAEPQIYSYMRHYNTKGDLQYSFHFSKSKICCFPNGLVGEQL